MELRKGLVCDSANQIVLFNPPCHLDSLLPPYLAWQLDKTKTAEDLYSGKNVVLTKSLIRVEADELTYPLHIILRYELETALLRGDIEVADLPALWNKVCREEA